jgi:amino acid transporter
VVADASEIEVIFADGTKSRAQVLIEQPENDIAVLSAGLPPEEVIPAILGNPNAMRIGDEAFVVGHPLGLYGSMMTGPRIFFAMADRGLFFRAVARVSPRYQSPSTAIWLATALGVVYVLLNDFQQLADKFILGIWPFYALAVAAVFVLRRSRPDLERPYRTWGYPVVPVLFLLASVGMVVNALVTDPVNTGITLGIIVVGVPVYYAWKAFKGTDAVGGEAA